MKPIVITAGEPAGIGPDCIIRASLNEPDAFDRCVIAAPASWLQERASMMNINLAIREFGDLDEAGKAVAAHAAGLSCWNPMGSQSAASVTASKPAAHTAAAVVGCIEAAARACLSKQADALVTGPIEKAVLRSAGFNFPGHTEFLAWLSSEVSVNDASDFVMMLASDHLRVALLTTHLPLRDVADALSVHETLKCLHIVAHDLRSRFDIKTPRLALCALNPHAGEQGHFGREEIDILAPAAQLARDQGVQVTAPLPADTVFSALVRKNYDAVVCCYHDQALIPIKALSFGEAVNVTLGLPFIRTSVDHGTALDRVGQTSVSCSSLLAAIHMAQQMSSRKSE